ncbi:hypothetical protein [Candidatus Phytoplasma rubi]
MAQGKEKVKKFLIKNKKIA